MTTYAQAIRLSANIHTPGYRLRSIPSRDGYAHTHHRPYSYAYAYTYADTDAFAYP